MFEHGGMGEGCRGIFGRQGEWVGEFALVEWVPADPARGINRGKVPLPQRPLFHFHLGVANCDKMV
jgi:hypothetical protein